MSAAVIDSSVILAILNEEVDAETINSLLTLLTDAAISTVNLAEIHSKLVLQGIDSQKAWIAALSAVGQVADFDQEQAKVAGSLIRETSRFGLSLGDRACLALGLVLNVPVYTADRAWKNLKIGLPINVIR